MDFFQLIEFFQIAFYIGAGATLGYFTVKALVEWLNELEDWIRERLKK